MLKKIVPIYVSSSKMVGKINKCKIPIIFKQKIIVNIKNFYTLFLLLNRQKRNDL